MISYPVAILGAGPVGQVAAAHAAARGLDFICLEQGSAAGSAVVDWGHVEVFSPCRYEVDWVAKDRLLANGWMPADPEAVPTGSKLVRSDNEELGRDPVAARKLQLVLSCSPTLGQISS